MSQSHKHNLPPIVNHHRIWGIEDCWQDVKCYPDREVTEICDVFGVTQRPVQGLWTDRNGQPVYLAAGTTFVGEYKDTKADLRADEAKACRRRDKKAMGDYRLVWIRKDGKIRPEDVDEEGPHYGWGVVVFDENAANIVRGPLRMNNVARWEQMRAYGQLLRSDHQAAHAATMANIQIHSPRPIQTTSAPRSETIRKDNGRYADKHTRAAEAYIAELPAKTSALLKHLESETGYSGTPDKLTKHLKNNSVRLIAPPPGGDWCITAKKGDKQCG